MHHFLNFKGFAEAKLDLFEPLTVLIGPNGSGKSNVIEAVELLSFVAQGRPLHEVVDVGSGTPGDLEIRGGLASCPRYGSPLFALGFSASIPFERERNRLRYDIVVQPEPYPRIALEKLIIGGEIMIFETVLKTDMAVSGDIKVRYNNFAQGGKKPIVRVPASRSVLSQYHQFATKNKKFKQCAQVVRIVSVYLSSSFVFDPAPDLMRSYGRIGDRQLTRNGKNLSAVLYSLRHGTEEQQESLERLFGWIKQLPEEPYSDLDFVATKLGDVIFGFKEDGNFVDARSLSNGTLRSLAVLTALETVAEGSRVIIEEFDNGLHPSRVRVLTQALRSCCERRKLNVLVTTHNPATLDCLDSEQLKGVVMCVWDDALESFNLVRLVDVPRYPELMERGRLGDLVTRRVVKDYLSPQFEEKRKGEALKWLEDLG